MVNIKEYNKKDDFLFHQDEFKRCLQIINNFFDLKNKSVLDVGVGSGLHTGFLANTGCKSVIGIDLLDYETLWGGGFKLKLLELYTDNGVQFNGDKCQFIKMNAENMLFREDLFDFVFCLNAFEHISDPKKALSEIWRVLKTDGFAFIQFDPVYYCDTGGHMYDFVPEPWGHLMYSNEVYNSKLKNAGAPEAIISDFNHGLNRKTKDYFLNLFKETSNDKMRIFEKVISYTWSGVVNENHKKHKNFNILKCNYPKEDLLFRGMNILLRKK
jgi:ubiquinone/menaquinone biosynthesis C-methylase UbiE